ncbi:MAG: Abi-alpha family protein [Porticoccaceae bacterium]
MTDEEAKATQEVAKTTSNAIDLAREAGGYIAKFISGSLEQGMGIVEDRLRYMRWERKIRLVTKANLVLREQGLQQPTRVVPLNIIVPLLEEGSMEENDWMQDRWATLLANAANADSGVDVSRSLIDILSQLGPTDTELLQRIYSVAPKDDVTGKIHLEWLPHLTESQLLAVENLARLGLTQPTHTLGGGVSHATVRQTLLGHALVKACNPNTQQVGD